MCLIPIVAPGASYHHTARQSATFQRFPKMHNLTPLRSMFCRLTEISISRMIDVVWFWVAHTVWTLNKTVSFKTETQWRTRTTNVHNYPHISCQECALQSVTASLWVSPFRRACTCARSLHMDSSSAPVASPEAATLGSARAPETPRCLIKSSQIVALPSAHLNVSH